jgi:multicomponent Na+:H+ antiporter subunit A
MLITGAGGVVMLAGLILIGQSSGTYRLSELIGNVPPGTTVSVGVVLVAIGAFTKSAQWPFSGWLPGAMVAPTPISTYLHAATMVKAGVYLVARLSPALADIGVWRELMLVAGSVTMLTGGWRAMRQHDLKLLLAYGTISQLGLLMLLFGMGKYALAQAGIVLLIAHAAFKAALFMVVGIVDHQAGTRDVRKLRMLGRNWRPVQLTSIVAAASMSGFPPLLGFIAKEKALDAGLAGGFSGSAALVAVVVVGSVLTFAYSGRFVLGVMGRLAEPGDEAVEPAAPPSVAFLAPAFALAVFSLAAGVAPVIVDRLVRTATSSLDPASSPKHVVLWAGFNTALLLSSIVIGVGALLVIAFRRVEAFQLLVHSLVARVPDSDRSFRAIVTGLSSSSQRVTRVVQNGSLPVYLMVIIGVAVGVPLIPAVAQLDALPDVIGPWVYLPISLLIVVAAIGATVVRRRIAAALLLGAVGFGMSGFYVVQGAPDLALTQFAIETLATVLFVLALRFLPRQFTVVSSVVSTSFRLAISILAGVSVFVLALVAGGARSDVSAPAASDSMIQRSVPEAKGSNVVNVILVDFRGLDTLGEIAVLVVAGLGVVALTRTTLVRDRTMRSFTPTPMIEQSARMLYASILVLSLYFLFAGHNQPGGGFVGGLTAGAAISLRYVAGGVASVRSAVRVPPWTVLGGGLLIAASTAIAPLLTGGAVLEHSAFERSFPLLGTVKATTALPFDVGVYLVVVGLILMAYEAFGDEADMAASERELVR